jgi:hypothetical protein
MQQTSRHYQVRVHLYRVTPSDVHVRTKACLLLFLPKLLERILNLSVVPAPLSRLVLVFLTQQMVTAFLRPITFQPRICRPLVDRHGTDRVIRVQAL